MRKLIGFGASSVQGVGDSQGGFFKRLEGKLMEAGKPHICLNHGIGGNSTRDMVARLPQVQAELPARIIVLLGCNDLPRERDAWPQARASVTEYAQNLEDILRTLAGPETIFVSSFSVDPQRTGVSPATFAEYMGEAVKIAVSFKLPIWNLYAESLTFGDKYLAADGLHFNDAGHEMIAEHLSRMISE